MQNTWKELYRFVYYRVQNQEEAEDITQETYAKAFEYWTKHEITITNYSSFLKTIALNIIRDQWRSRKRKGQLIEIEKAEPEAMAVNDFSGETEDRALLTEAISKLPIEQQTVIGLRILQGYSSAETARQMNKKERTVRVLQFRAIKALKKLLEE